MARVFEMITVTDKDAKGQAGVAIGINVKIGGNETVCPVTRVCNSIDDLEAEIKSLNDGLEDIFTRARTVIEGPSSEAVFEFKPDMSPREIWTILSSIADEKIFIDYFNNMDEKKRKEVADHVLASCNIFSGKGAVFSSRYNNDSGLIE